MMQIRAVNEPSALPISLAEIKTQLRWDSTALDDEITSLIYSAVDVIEGEIHRPLVQRQYQLTADCFPALRGDYIPPHLSRLERSAFFLEKPPVIQVDSVQYVDTAGDTQTLATSDYQADLASEPARVFPAFNNSWPATRTQANAVTVLFRAGYLIPFSVDAGTDTITTPGYSPSNGTRVRFSTSGGTLPSPLVELTDFFVISASGESWSVSLTSGGTAVDLSSVGSGLFFVGELPKCVKQAIKLLVHDLFYLKEISTKTINDLLNSARWTW